jgi:hypothetical protein
LLAKDEEMALFTFSSYAQALTSTDLMLMELAVAWKDVSQFNKVLDTHLKPK